MALFSDLVGTISQATYFARLMARHVANGVPTDTWLSLVNTGLSTTQYTSEVYAQLRALITGIFRALFIDEWQGLIDGAIDAADLAAIEARIEVVARNVYGITRESAQLQLARFVLTSATGAPPQSINPGDSAGTIGTTGPIWYAAESAQLEPGQDAVVLYRAGEAGASYNVPIGTSLELKTSLVGVSVDNRASGAATALGVGSAGLLLFAAQSGVTVRVVNNGASLPLNTTGNLGTKLITIQLRTDGAGVALSTADEVRLALNAAVAALGIPQLLLYASLAGSGAGVMQVTATPVALAWDGSYIQEAGADPEAIARLRRRCEARLDTIGGGGGSGVPGGAVGTEDALVYWALATPAGYKAPPVRWVRVLSNNKLGAMSGGESTVVLAGPAGGITAADVTAVAANFEAPKKYWGGLNVVSAITAPIAIVGTVHVRPASGKTLSDVSASVAVALAQFLEIIGDEWSVNDTPLVYPDKILAIISGADNVAISHVDLTVPAAPITLAWNEFPTFDTAALAYTYG